MLRAVILATLGLCIGGCEAPPLSAGDACESWYQCPGDLVCNEGQCTDPLGEGATCDPSLTRYESLCAPSLTCADDAVCRTSEDIQERQEAADLAQETQMLTASGLTPEDVAPVETAEAPIAAPGPGLPVRTVDIRGTGRALAACRSTERLVGGSCHSPWSLSESGPTHTSVTDTVGARWNCVASEAPAPVRAIALCQALPGLTSVP